MVHETSYYSVPVLTGVTRVVFCAKIIEASQRTIALLPFFLLLTQADEIKVFFVSLIS